MERIDQRTVDSVDNRFDLLPKDLICKIFSSVEDDVEGKMRVSLCCKRFLDILSDERSWLFDTNLILTTSANGRFMVNGKIFTNHRAQKAIQRYLRYVFIDNVVISCEGCCSITNMQVGQIIVENRERFRLTKVHFIMDGNRDVGIAGGMCSAISQVAVHENIKNLSLEVRSRTDWVPDLYSTRAMVQSCVFPFFASCPNIKSLSLRSSIARICENSMVLLLLKQTPKLECFVLDTPDSWIEGQCNSLGTVLSAKSLTTLVVSINFGMSAYFFDHYTAEARFRVRKIRIPMDDLEESGWHVAQEVVERTMDRYPSLRFADVNFKRFDRNWQPFVIRKTIENALKVLKLRENRELELHMRPSCRSTLLQSLGSIKGLTLIEQESEFIYKCYSASAVVKLHID